MTLRALRGDERETLFRRAHARDGAQQPAEPPDLHPQARAVGFVDVLGAERAGKQHVPRHVSGPRLAERAREREQHRAPCERHQRIPFTHEIAAGVDHKRRRRKQRLDLLQQQRPLLPTRNQPRRGRIEAGECLFHLCRERRNACPARGFLGAGKCRVCCLGADTPHGNSGDRKLMDGPQRGRQGRKIELRQPVFGLVEMPDQKQAPNFEVACMGGVRPVAVRRQGRRRRGEGFRRPREVARGERNLRLRDDAPRPRDRLSWTEGARRAPHQRSRAVEIAKLCHGNTAKRERWRIVAERDPVQRAEGIAHRERSGCGRDQRVHRNPVTLVTPRGAPVQS